MSEVAEFFRSVELQLEMPIARRFEVMRELTSHYEEIVSDLVASGSTQDQARMEGLARLGSPLEIAARLNAVHNTVAIRPALLCAVPFVGWAICLMLPTPRAQMIGEAILGALLLIGVAREFVGRRRPVWLATWLAASCMGLWHLVLGTSPSDPARALFAGVSLLLALLVVWRSPESRQPHLTHTLLLLGCVAAGALPDHVPLAYLLRAVALAVMAPCLILTASGVLYGLGMRLFAWDRQGGAWRASLFLYSVCAFLMVRPSLIIDLRLCVAGFLVAGLAAMLFVRVPGWWPKVSALTAGLLAKLASQDAFGNLSHTDARIPIVDLERYLWFLLLVGGVLIAWSLAPMLSERAERGGQRRAAVHQ